jgi:membrane-bound inhibitor of C-type lysozyme
MSRALKVSSSAVAKTIMKLALMRSAMGKKTQSYLCCREEVRVTSLRNCSPNKCFTELK